MRNIVANLAGAMFGLLVIQPTVGQEYPNKPIRQVVQSAAGSFTDVITRSVVSEMATNLGQPIIVENRPGASGMVAYEYVAKQAPADGYTLVSGGGLLASVPIFVKDLRFDPLRDLVPVTFFADGPLVLAAPIAAPFGNFKEFIAYARANPGKLNWGTQGFTTMTTLNIESIAKQHALQIVQIPFQGGNIKARPELISNRIQLLWYTMGEYVVDAADAKIKALMISSANRLPDIKDVPTATELGHPEISGVLYGLSVRSGTAKPIVDKLYAAVVYALQQQSVKELFAKSRVTALGTSPDSTMKQLLELNRNYRDIAAKAGIKPE